MAVTQWEGCGFEALWERTIDISPYPSHRRRVVIDIAPYQPAFDARVHAAAGLTMDITPSRSHVRRPSLYGR